MIDIVKRKINMTDELRSKIKWACTFNNCVPMIKNGSLKIIENSHLKEIQETATERVEKIIKQLKLKSNLTEDMKNTDMLYWVGMMNNFKNQAEEIVFNELIYV